MATIITGTSLSTTTVNAISNKASSLNTVINYTVSESDLQTIDLTNLDIQKGELYKLYISVPSFDGFSFIHIYVNEEYTDTAYSSLRFQMTSTGGTGTISAYTPVLAAPSTGAVIVLTDIMLDQTGNLYAVGTHNWTEANSAEGRVITTKSHGKTWSSITSLRLYAVNGAFFNVGTQVKLVKVI